MEESDYAPEPGDAPMLERLSLADFEERIAEQMVGPAYLLTIKYASFSKAENETIRFLSGWTTRKQ
ncbi:hypothetical protein [Burkholderia cepacia]|uniref:hypothetical protein n=1 Tax=Burkholderia cepacia TaxID=292 RepID=UPI00158B5731|nr:hypothetical protein [Burkholderia cepacia]